MSWHWEDTALCLGFGQTGAEDYQLMNQSVFLSPKITNCSQSQMAFTNCTDATPSALRPSNQLREEPVPSRENEREIQNKDPIPEDGQMCPICHI